MTPVPIPTDPQQQARLQPHETLSAYAQRLDAEVSSLPELEASLTHLTARLALARACQDQQRRLQAVAAGGDAPSPPAGTPPAVTAQAEAAGDPPEETPADPGAAAPGGDPGAGRPAPDGAGSAAPRTQQQRLADWASTRMDRARRYTSGEIADELGFNRKSMGKVLKEAVDGRHLVRVDVAGDYPRYVHPDFTAAGPPDVDDRARLLAVLQADPQTDLNMDALLERAGEPPIPAETARPLLLALAEDGQIHACTYPAEDEAEEWFSLTPPLDGAQPLVRPAAGGP